MTNTIDDNFDDIDINELFNDFNEKQSPIPRQPLSKYTFNSKTNPDDLFEFNETDCTAPRIIRKRIKPKNKSNTKQMTMYDYASSISYKHKQFYSSLDNTTTTKTILKPPKRSLTDFEESSPISKKIKTFNNEHLSSTSPPDFIDNLLRYLDDRSRNKTEEQKNVKTD